MPSKKSEAVLQKLIQQEKESIKRMNKFGRHQFLVQRFGNESKDLEFLSGCFRYG